MTAAELLSVAAFQQGRHAQSVPSFGSERTGGYVLLNSAVINLDEPGPYRYEIDLDFCNGRGLCAEEGPAGAIEMEPEQI